MINLTQWLLFIASSKKKNMILFYAPLLYTRLRLQGHAEELHRDFQDANIYDFLAFHVPD